LKNKKNIPLD